MFYFNIYYFLSLIFVLDSSSDGLRPLQLDRETRRIGRGLMKTDDENGDEDDDNDYDDDYDFADMECANVTFTPILRCFNDRQCITLQFTIM